MMRMKDKIVIVPGQKVDFAPGGLHIMLSGLKGTFAVGQSVPLVLLTRGRRDRSPSPRSSSRWYLELRSVSRPDTPLDHVTPYDRLAWSDTQVEHLLAIRRARARVHRLFRRARNMRSS